MIPIKLTIEGIYSYQKKQVIDFTTLTGGNLFGIFGSVGSGKSSILEAITFALYGNTQRLNISGDNRYYNMMNLKSNKLLIDFEFRIDNNDYFRFVVSSKRNKNNYDDVRSFSRSAYKKNGSDWEPIETNADNIIGLDYSNFIKTIIIPQGHFRDFLGMTEGDRTKLLKKIFNLEKYDLFNQAKTLINAANKTQENLLGQLHQIGDVSK
jgi:exonuclease SbcC